MTAEFIAGVIALVAVLGAPVGWLINKLFSGQAESKSNERELYKADQNILLALEKQRSEFLQREIELRKEFQKNNGV
jgi:hypothetical protein